MKKKCSTRDACSIKLDATVASPGQWEEHPVWSVKNRAGQATKNEWKKGGTELSPHVQLSLCGVILLTDFKLVVNYFVNQRNYLIICCAP